LCYDFLLTHILLYSTMDSMPRYRDGIGVGVRVGVGVGIGAYFKRLNRTQFQ